MSLRVRLSDAEQIDHEDQRLASERMPGTGRSVCELRGHRELAASADAHARNAFLPARDQASEREADGVATSERRVEHIVGVVLHAVVVHVDHAAGLRFVAVTDGDVLDDEIGGREGAGGGLGSESTEELGGRETEAPVGEHMQCQEWWTD